MFWKEILLKLNKFKYVSCEVTNKKIGNKDRNEYCSVAKKEREKDKAKPSLVVTWALGQITCTAEEIRKDNN